MLTREQAQSVLGLDSTFDPATLRETYRARVREVHPDLVPESERARAESELRSVLDAYQILSAPMSQPTSAVANIEIRHDARQVTLDNDDHEVSAAIVSLILAAGLFGLIMYVVTTHILPRGISQSATIYSFMGLFVLWGALYCLLVPVMESAAKKRLAKKHERINS